MVPRKVAIHNKGPKVQRDRETLTKLYDSFCRAFPWYMPVSSEAMAKLDNLRLRALCEGVWDNQSMTDQQAYVSLMKTQPDAVVSAPAPLRFRPMVVPVDFQDTQP